MPSSVNSAAPYSPRLATTTSGPRSIVVRAAWTRFGCSVSIRSSASLSSRHSTSPIAATSESRAVSIQRFIESSAAKLAADCRLTSRCSSGWMLPRKSICEPHDSGESLGRKSANTWSCVSSVWATFMSWS